MTDIADYDTVDFVLHDPYEAATEICKLREREARLREALTPSADTKAAYIGEFQFTVERVDGDGHEYTEEMTVPWTTTKEIMDAIARRALSDAPQSDGWVSVAERLPENGQRVDVWLDLGEYAMRDTNVLFQYDKFMSECRDAVSHWMPLPSAPKGGEV